MKVKPMAAIPDGIAGRAESLHSSGADLDTILLELRALGLDKIDSIRVLRNRAGMSLAEAKRVVHLSNTWNSRREADDCFHDTLADQFGGPDRQPLPVTKIA